MSSMLRMGDRCVVYGEGEDVRAVVGETRAVPSSSDRTSFLSSSIAASRDEAMSIMMF